MNGSTPGPGPNRTTNREGTTQAATPATELPHDRLLHAGWLSARCGASDGRLLLWIPHPGGTIGSGRLCPDCAATFPEPVVWAYVKLLVALERKGNVEPSPKPVATTAKRSYREYLNSPIWRRTRDLALEYYGRKCCLCNSTRRLNVHHRTYERVGSEQLADLIVLCHYCHKRYHGKAA